MVTDDGNATIDGPDDIERLLEEMTLREKAAQLAGTYVGDMGELRTLEDTMELIREHNIGFATPFGYGESPHTDPIEVATIANELQEIALEETRLGIPLLIPVDAVHGHAYVEEATVFPHNLGLAATRDRELAERIGAVTAREVDATGASLTYGPICDVARDPRWGRTFETFGESPFLCGEFAAAKVRGAEGADADVATMAKHFPAYGEPERGEDASPVDRSRSSIVRDFLAAFEPALEAGVDGIMPSYNSINGVPAHASEHYLTTVLRERLGFDGYVASDWNGVRMLHEDHRIAPTMREAIRRSIEAGLDVHSLGEGDHVEHVAALVENGKLEESVVDDCVRRVLELKLAVGLFDDPYVDVERTTSVVGADEHREVALETSRKAMTLLENDGGLLPLSPDVDEVLVAGPNADSLTHQVGGWSFRSADELGGTTVREGIEAVTSAETTVTYERGAGIDERDDLEAAAAAAERADVAVVALGENWYFHEFGPREVTGPTGGFPNRTELELPPAQRELLEAIHATGTPTVLVSIAGRPLAIPWAAENVPAILQAFYPGIEGGLAVAETLFGEHNPSGALPISVPRSAGHLPTRHNYLAHPHPIGDDEHPSSYDPLWPFGHGLSYTEFEYRDLEPSAETIDPDGAVTVEVELANVGERAGAETVHVYASRPYSSTVTPVRQLVGFERVELAAGEATTAAVDVPAERFAVVGTDGRRTVEPGDVDLTCGEFDATIRVER